VPVNRQRKRHRFRICRHSLLHSSKDRNRAIRRLSVEGRVPRRPGALSQIQAARLFRVPEHRPSRDWRGPNESAPRPEYRRLAPGTIAVGSSSAGQLPRNASMAVGTMSGHVFVRVTGSILSTEGEGFSVKPAGLQRCREGSDSSEEFHKFMARSLLKKPSELGIDTTSIPYYHRGHAWRRPAARFDV
jgi:hypothetical protein